MWGLNTITVFGLVEFDVPRECGRLEYALRVSINRPGRVIKVPRGSTAKLLAGFYQLRPCQMQQFANGFRQWRVESRRLPNGWAAPRIANMGVQIPAGGDDDVTIVGPEVVS